MSKMYVVFLSFLALTSAGVSMQGQKTTGKSPGKPSELTPRRRECAILMPERGERHDLARLVRADEFLDCERDGFPKDIAPPWKSSEEVTRKLGEACGYFAEKSAKEYPQAAQADLKLAADRCRVNIMTIKVMGLIPWIGRLPK